jgi:hypothetical protein
MPVEGQNVDGRRRKHGEVKLVWHDLKKEKKPDCLYKCFFDVRVLLTLILGMPTH